MGDRNLDNLSTSAGGDSSSREDGIEPNHPQSIGRYRIDRVLGRGGFGLVYLAFDEELDRQVAVKVPHADLVARAEDADAYRAEAQTVAKLDHPHIVPVFDAGAGTSDYPFYVISKYIEGTSLAESSRHSRIQALDAAMLVATVADALHYAHKQGLVHRDVKPGNILIDQEGRPHLVDFGLALREENVGKGPAYAGTPSYMSPEQARGEGHRVDGRSDIFSLGVVLYELLVGRRPFRGDTRHELLEQVTTLDPRPLRQYNEKLPQELERICHKAIAKRASERYSSAHDFSEDLRQLVADHAELRTSTVVRPSATSETQTANGLEFLEFSVPEVESGPTSRTPSSTSQNTPLWIVPKGLRSFDAHDADFFLELLPGPRDRLGLPDGLRFWKTRVEQRDGDETFPVGLIFGPSGCGKSSLIKAGLLPRLSDEIATIYIEATPDETEQRLQRGLAKRCPDLATAGLADALAALRRGEGLPPESKLLIVIDQFEQWLHARDEDEYTELVRALRQCDGGRVQCIVMVRDDFWMAATRFFRDVEVRLLEDNNLAAVDLFPERHARKVLAAFGRAFGAIPEDANAMTREQEEFLRLATEGLANEGKIICVRLSLFAEMMKGRPWTPASLKAVGGTQGVGAKFLEETFNSSTSAPTHRYHQEAARRVLKALLPESGSDIKGEMKSRDELVEASGYARRPQDFDELIGVLDGEIRLVTPTDPDGVNFDSESSAAVDSEQKYYQLTHDYLVPALRTWLTRKQKQTKRGRAELVLSERSSEWHSRPINRNLPSWKEHLNIRLWTNSEQWSATQAAMMSRAARVHGRHAVLCLATVTLLVVTAVTANRLAWRRQQAAEATRLVEGLLQADTVQVGRVIDELDSYRDWADDDLSAAFLEHDELSNAKLHAALAMLNHDDQALPFLKRRLLSLPPRQFQAVRDLLASERSTWIADYWGIALDVDESDPRRFRAACALADFCPDHDHWTNESLVDFVTRQLVDALPSELKLWQEILRPVRSRLTPSLSKIYRDTESGEKVRAFATDTLADYGADDSDLLFDLLMSADETQFRVIYDKIASHRMEAVDLGRAELMEVAPDSAEEHELERLARRQGNAAIMLLRLEAGTAVWPLFKWTADSRRRGFVINRFREFGGNAETILERYAQETDQSARLALLLCIGDFELSELPPGSRDDLIEELLNLYRHDPDPGLHAGAEWVLRRWQQQAALDKILEDWTATARRESPRQRVPDGRWLVNGQGQTLVVLTGETFWMGTRPAGPNNGALLHERRVPRKFAIGNKEVTKAQWRLFCEGKSVLQADATTIAKHVRTDDSPMGGVSWHEAAWYCNWLSEQENIPPRQWCYEANDDGEYRTGMRAKPGFLELSGYRLPTEPEWELASRAGSVTRRHFGQEELVLDRYAWYAANSEQHTWPVGRLKPNDFGMFDMLGNAWEWCYDTRLDYPSESKAAAGVVDDAPATDPVKEADERVIRGGGALNGSGYVRSAYRLHYRPDYRSNTTGFRVARTIESTPEP